MARAKSSQSDNPKPRASAKKSSKPRKGRVTALAPVEPAAFEQTMVDADVSAQAEADGGTTLPECLDSAAATSVRDMLLAERGKAITIDASQVRRLGAQSLQVLIAAARTWDADGQSFTIASPSNEFIETIARSGLSREDFHIEGSAL